MNCTGTFERMDIDFSTKKLKVTFLLNEYHSVAEGMEKMRNYECLDIEVKKHRKKRSLDANAYAWVLMSKIADVTGSSKDIVYEEMLRRKGQPMLNEDGSGIAVTLPGKVDISKLGIHLKLIGTHDKKGKQFNSYIVLRGSSEYNTEEMASFIDEIVLECKELGIETMADFEIEQMKQQWGIVAEKTL